MRASVRHRPSEKNKRIPQLAVNSSLGEIYFVEPAKITVIKKSEVSFSPIQCRFKSRTPCSGKPDTQRNRKAMFWPIPDFSGQKTAGDRKKECFELPTANFFVRWQRKDAIKNSFVESHQNH